MNRKFHPALRIIASFLLVSFFLRDVAFAAIDFKPAQFDLFQKPLVNFQIPRSVALIEDAWDAKRMSPSNTSSPNALVGDRTIPAKNVAGMTLFLIQDAHTNESGQFNAAKALEIILRSQSRHPERIVRHFEGAQATEKSPHDEISRFARNDDFEILRGYAPQNDLF